MDHLAADPKRLDLYLAARLAPEDEAAFEEHLIECAPCREEVAWAERFRGALRAAAAEDAAQVAATGVLAWLARQSRLGRGALLAAAALLLLLPSALLLSRQDRQDRQGRLERELAHQREQAARLGEENRLLVAAAAKSPPPARPGAALLIPLALLRSGSPPGFRLGTGPVVLSVDLPPAPAPAYRATLLDASGAVLWQESGLQPSLYGTLLISLPPAFLKPGAYRLRLDGGGTPAGELPFRVLDGAPPGR